MRRALVLVGVLAATVALFAACGGRSYTHPTPGDGGNGGDGGNSEPPPNNLPVIESITIQGSRPKEPANFADVGEIVDVIAKVKDDETPVEQLEFQWSAKAGTFDGTGPAVHWQAPAEAETPMEVTITLKVVEKYGFPDRPAIFSHDASGDAKLSLHNSIKEVGEISRQFLLDFSDSNILDIDYIMRNFGSRETCPESSEPIKERDEVTENRQTRKILNYRIGDPVVFINFAGRCPYRNKRGDACAIVPAFWESTRISDGAHGTTEGFDVIAAAYAIDAARWWLCASDWDGRTSSGVPLRLR